MHILEKVPETEWSFRIFPRGQKLPDGQEPATLDLSGETLQSARSRLEEILQIPEREPLQLPWGIFQHKGKRIKDMESLKKVQLAFIIEIGVWMWPAVRVGFEQTIPDLRADGGPVTLRTRSLRPVVIEVDNFMTEEETEKVKAIGQTQGLVSSQGAMQSHDIAKGTTHDSFRTSKQAWLMNELDPLIDELDKRTSRLTRVHRSHNEPVQLLRYDVGKYYHAHMDWMELDLYPDQPDMWLRSHFGYQDRLATVFWYLNDVAEGGETIFPKHGQPICWPEARGSKATRMCPGAHDPHYANCDDGLKVKPKRGTVILWYNYLASGRGDRNALHGGCPVGENLTKWSGNKWVRIKPLSQQASWIDNHPALERYGYTPPGGAAQSSASADCAISFANNAQEEVKLLWIPDAQGEKMTLASVPAGQTISQSSYNGHQFQLTSASGQISNVVKCEPPTSSFVLSPSFALEHAGTTSRARTEL
eukprot:TRINITY_DN69059_c0_g1_i1.p1 TRINITY_DN69059_c0_g1~~TRINITY_DN69059_c0_g1_i1.p1  ORF type:complete len:532 (-),score=94.33 TRINITY_DN69059_c0_g1_i1:72-1499(-)